MLVICAKFRSYSGGYRCSEWDPHDHTEPDPGDGVSELRVLICNGTCDGPVCHSEQCRILTNICVSKTKAVKGANSVPTVFHTNVAMLTVEAMVIDCCESQGC